MNINQQYMQRLIKDAQAYNHGIDYLNLVVYDEIDFGKYFKLLNKSNSSSKIIEGELFTYTLQKDSKAKMSTIWVNIALDDIPYGIIKITDYRQGGCVQNNYSITIPGALFRLVEMGEIEDFYQVLIDLFGGDDFWTILRAPVNRMDYKVDILFAKEGRLIPKLDKLVSTQRKATEKSYSIAEDSHKEYLSIARAIRDGKDMNIADVAKQVDGVYSTGWSIGTKNNKQAMIRCYEKTIDSIEKGKYALCQDYFNYGTAWRIEAELQDNFCREGGERILLNVLDDLILKAQAFMGIKKSRSKQKYFYRPNPKLHNVNVSYKKNYCKRGETIMINQENPFELQYSYLLAKGYEEKMLQGMVSKMDKMSSEDVG